MLAQAGVPNFGQNEHTELLKAGLRPSLKLTVSPESSNGRLLKSMHRISFSRPELPDRDFRKSSTNTCTDSKGSSTKFGTQEFAGGTSSLQVCQQARASIESPLKKAIRGSFLQNQSADHNWQQDYHFPGVVAGEGDQKNLRSHQFPATFLTLDHRLETDQNILDQSQTDQRNNFTPDLNHFQSKHSKSQENAEKCKKHLHQLPYISLKFRTHPDRKIATTAYNPIFKKFKSHRSPKIPCLPGDLTPVGTPPAKNRELFLEQLSQSSKAGKEKQTDRTITEGVFLQKSMFWIDQSSVRDAPVNDKSSVLGAKDHQQYTHRVKNPRSSREFFEMDLQLQKVTSNKSAMKASNLQLSFRMEKSSAPYEVSNISMGKPPTFIWSGKNLPLHNKNNKMPRKTAADGEEDCESRVSSLEQPKLRGTVSGASLPQAPRESSGRMPLDTNPDLGELLKTFGLNPPIF